MTKCIGAICNYVEVVVLKFIFVICAIMYICEVCDVLPMPLKDHKCYSMFDLNSRPD